MCNVKIYVWERIGISVFVVIIVVVVAVIVQKLYKHGSSIIRRRYKTIYTYSEYIIVYSSSIHYPQ